MIKNPGVMSDELFEKILRELTEWESELNRGKLCPYLMNEPFCDKKLEDRVALIREYLPSVPIEISTNAELATKQRIEKLEESLAGTPHVYWISRHGITDEEIKRNMSIDPQRSERNILDLIEVVDGQAPIVIKGFLYSFDMKIAISKPAKFVRIWKRKISDLNARTDNVIVKALSFHDRSGNVNIEGWNKLKTVRRIGPRNRFYCPRVDQWLHILWNGDLVLCCNDYHHETVFGNLSSNTIKEVLASEAYKTLKKKVLGEIETEPDFICNRCTRIGG